MSKYFVSIVISVLLSPVLAGAQSFGNVLAATDPALAAAFTAALKNVPAAPAPKAYSAAGETKAAYPATDYVPLHRGGVYNYEYTSNEFQGVRSLRVEFGAYSAKDQAVTVTVTDFSKSRPQVSSYRMALNSTGLFAEGSPLGGGRLEMPANITYNLAWDEGPSHSRVAAVNNSVKVGGVEYKGCVRIVTRVAGGGSANRYYAPGVGLVLEQSISSARQVSLGLVSYSLN